MSHDRGCFKCHEDPSEYARCQRADCPKRHGRGLFRKPSVVDAALARGERELALVDLPETRPTCLACGRAQPLWGCCLRPPAECPVRAAFEPGRPATRIISVNEPGYEIALFFKTDGSAQAIISRPGGKDTIDVLIASPIPGRCIAVERKGEAFNVMYRDTQP